MAISDDSVAPSPADDVAQTKHVPAHELAACALDAAAERKARNLTILDLREVSSVADFFVIATGDSKLHVRAIVRAVENHLDEQCNELPWRSEGREHRQWVVLDYVTLVVHTFTEEKRDYYGLERLWGDAPSEDVPAEVEDSSTIDLLQRISRGEDL